MPSASAHAEPPRFVIGLILGTHYWRYRSIGAIIAGRFLWDWILLTAIFAVTP
jgi:hypothetical protein